MSLRDRKTREDSEKMFEGLMRAEIDSKGGDVSISTTGLFNMYNKLKIEAEYHFSNLRQLAESIHRDMGRLIEKLEEDGYDANYNSLGELQGRATQFDRECGQLDQVVKILKNFNRTIGRDFQEQHSEE